MSLLLALTGAPSIVEQKHGGVTRRVRSGRVYEKFDPVEVEIEPAPAVNAGPNALLFADVQQRQAKLIERAEAVRVEQAAAQASAALAKAAQDAQRVRAAQQQIEAAQAEMRRIAQEIEEMDVAYIVALMD